MDALLQSINQSIDQTIVQTIVQSSNNDKLLYQTNDQSMNQSINLTNQWLNESTNQWTNQWINKSIHLSIHQSINPLVIESINESMHQCVNQWINKSMMHACLPACLAGFFFPRPVSLSLSPRLRVRASPCVSLYVSLFFVYVWPFSWSIALSAKRTLLFMIYDIFMIFIGCFSVAILLERRCTGILGFGRLAGFLLSKERETSNQTRVLLRSITSNCGILDDRKRLHSWCFLGSCLDTVHVLVLLK